MHHFSLYYSFLHFILFTFLHIFLFIFFSYSFLSFLPNPFSSSVFLLVLLFHSIEYYIYSHPYDIKYLEKYLEISGIL